MTLLERNYTEKRDYIRLPVNTPAKLLLAEEEEGVSCTCRNLSAAGMLLEVDREFEPGTSLSVSISTERDGYEPLSADVTVSRCVSFNDNQYLLGVVIDEMK